MVIHPTRSFAVLAAALTLASVLATSVSPAAADPDDRHRRSDREGRAKDYRVRWAAVGGRRIDYIVDAESGRILWEDAR